MGTLRQEVKRLAQVERDKDAEIARLQAEVERLSAERDDAVGELQDIPHLFDLKSTAWNDAIEAAARHCEKHMKAGGCAGVLIRALRKDNA